MRSLLPPDVQHHFPFEFQIPNTGLTPMVVQLFGTLAAQGVSTTYLTNSVIDLRTHMYESEHQQHAEWHKISQQPC